MEGYYSKKCLCGKGGKWIFHGVPNKSYLCENHMIEWLSWKAKSLLTLRGKSNE